MPRGRRALLGPDTAAEIERRQVERWREMDSHGRLAAAGRGSVAVAQLALAGTSQRVADRDGQLREYARVKLGRTLAAAAIRVAPEALASAASMDPLDVVLLVARVFETCGVRYVLGGSLASSVSGEPRATLDADVMVDLPAKSIACVLEALGRDFYADGDAFARAVRDRASVNIIHLPSATKVDLFVMGATPIEARQMDRRQKIPVGDPPRGELYIYTAEDIVLQKLRWFRLGAERSDRQWRDVLGIALVQRARLDRDYLRQAASTIGVLDLLDRALTEADRADG